MSSTVSEVLVTHVTLAQVFFSYRCFFLEHTASSKGDISFAIFSRNVFLLLLFYSLFPFFLPSCGENCYVPSCVSDSARRQPVMSIFGEPVFGSVPAKVEHVHISPAHSSCTDDQLARRGTTFTGARPSSWRHSERSPVQQHGEAPNDSSECSAPLPNPTCRSLLCDV